MINKMNKDIIYALTQHKVRVYDDMMLMELKKSVTTATTLDDYKSIYEYILRRYPETIKDCGDIIGIFMDEKAAEFALNKFDIEFSNYDRGCFLATFYEIHKYGIDTEYHKRLVDSGYNIKDTLSECEYLGLHSMSVVKEEN